MKFFAGLKVAEIADVLKVSPETVNAIGVLLKPGCYANCSSPVQ
jgi:hypothetical protein